MAITLFKPGVRRFFPPDERRKNKPLTDRTSYREIIQIINNDNGNDFVEKIPTSIQDDSEKVDTNFLHSKLYESIDKSFPSEGMQGLLKNRLGMGDKKISLGGSPILQKMIERINTPEKTIRFKLPISSLYSLYQNYLNNSDKVPPGEGNKNHQEVDDYKRINEAIKKAKELLSRIIKRETYGRNSILLGIPYSDDFAQRRQDLLDEYDKKTNKLIDEYNLVGKIINEEGGDITPISPSDFSRPRARGNTNASSTSSRRYRYTLSSSGGDQPITWIEMRIM